MVTTIIPRAHQMGIVQWLRDAMFSLTGTGDGAKVTFCADISVEFQAGGRETTIKRLSPWSSEKLWVEQNEFLILGRDCFDVP
jgi:hypothetical protein